MFEFSSNERFRIIRQLGVGGMGVVYEAWDNARDARVALKALPTADPNMLYRFKKEFRSLRGIAHPNLVSLGELFEQRGSWYFTMEFLEGTDLLSYFHKDRRSSPMRSEVDADLAATRSITRTLNSIAAFDLENMQPSGTTPGHVRAQGTRPVRYPEPRIAVPEEASVRLIFGQIAEGLIAIHEAGKVHRDIKPSNIIVTADSRAVLLDFGLITDSLSTVNSQHNSVVGTIAYMAPEQAAGEHVGPAADWYSLGVTLFQVLTGKLPLDGPPIALLQAKQIASPRDPRELKPECPAELAELCRQLLHGNANHRPDGKTILDRLRQPRSTGVQVSEQRHAPSLQQLFVGRARELNDLQLAFDNLANSHPITVFTYGESGIGKSALIQQFSSSLGASIGDCVILAGRCYEHEVVPFKALDGVIDALSRYIRGLSDVAAAELMPRHASLLPRVFPVLGRVPMIAAQALRSPVGTEDLFEIRRKVFAAMREMIYRLSERHPLVITIDDMQWVDSDSLRLLRNILRSPEGPRLLFLATSRFAKNDMPDLPGDVRYIPLQPLNSEESRTLADMFLQRWDVTQQVDVTRIVNEAEGHPLYIAELARSLARDGATRQLRLDEAIWERASQLEPVALTILKTLSLAVSPVSEEIVRIATGVKAEDCMKQLSLLRSINLVRGASQATALVEPYHDRVRDAVISRTPPEERSTLNERLAIALESRDSQVPPEILIFHWEAAGHLEKAAHKARESAERATASVAFDRSADLYRIALRLGQWSEADRRTLLMRLGEVLAFAGRCVEAAEAYTQAALGADRSTNLTCRIQVADQLVQSGMLERGLELLLSLFDECGHSPPKSQQRAIMLVGWYRLKLLKRGLEWIEQDQSNVLPHMLTLLSLYRAASRGLLLIDPVRAAYFVIRGLYLALECGCPEHINYFMMLEGTFRWCEGTKRGKRFATSSWRYMKEYSDPWSVYVVLAFKAARLLQSVDYEFREAADALIESEKQLTQVANTAWELSAVRFFLIRCFIKMGDFTNLRSTSKRIIHEAEQRGNLYLRTTIRRMSNILWLVDDDTEGARRNLEAESWISYSRGYHMQHWAEFYARAEVALYEGVPLDDAFLASHTKALKRAFLERMLSYRADTAWLLGRLALMGMNHRAAVAGDVMRQALRLESQGTCYTKALAASLRSSLQLRLGDQDRALSALRETIALGEQASMYFVVAVARRRLGALIGGASGEREIAMADEWMTSAGVKDMRRMIRLVDPSEG